MPDYPDDPRRAALETLLRLGSSPVQAVLAAHLRRLPSGPSRALCTELVYGVLRLELRLDAVLSRLLRQPDRLPREVLLALRLAAYALLFLRVPPYVTVDWTVRRVRRIFGDRLSRLANGVLRSLQRLGDAPLHEDFYAFSAPDPLARAALFHGVPLWMARLWEHAYGTAACARLLERSARQPWTCLRCNPRHPHGPRLYEALCALPHEVVAPNALAFAPGTLPDTLCDAPLDHWLEDGACSRQSPASPAILHALRCPSWPTPVWDACAGQGGKTLALLEYGIPVTLASDTHGRLRRLPAEARRLRLSPPSLCYADARRPPLRAWTGTILLDVPCSGLGTLARRPDIRRRPPAAIPPLLTAQAALLNAAWSLLSPGGCLVYMTCTLNPAENDAQLAAFLQRHPHARTMQQWQTPHDHPWLEGMFGVCVEK